MILYLLGMLLFQFRVEYVVFTPETPLTLYPIYILLNTYLTSHQCASFFILLSFLALQNLLKQKIVVEGKNVDIEEYNPSFITGLSLFTSLFYAGIKIDVGNMTMYLLDSKRKEGPIVFRTFLDTTVNSHVRYWF